jgi:catechol 2,3-dioxygenase-like lactoylglutathione lyase family enzyme
VSEVAVEANDVVLDHISLPVRRYREARRLYEAAFGAIGMTVNLDVGDACGMGAHGEKIFWLVRNKNATGGEHCALRVGRRDLVDAFHAAAMEAGAEDNGAPGPRPSYGPNYYAAFVKDGEGNNVEVVCYEPARRAAPKPRSGSNGRAKRAHAARPTRGRTARRPKASRRRSA